MEGTKRSLSSDDGDDSTTPAPSKKQRRERNGDETRGPTDTDATYGQRFVFPSLDEPTAPSSDEEYEVEDEQDALAYLRSVRQEASSIPHLLVAPKAGPQLPSPPRTRARAEDELSYDDDDGDGDDGDEDSDDAVVADRSIYTNGIGDSRGYYYDGTYTALPDDVASETDSSSAPARSSVYLDDAADAANVATARRRDEAVRQAFYASIVTRFSTLRQQMHTSPSDDALLALPDTHGFEVENFTTRRGGAGIKSYKLWRWRLTNTDPLPAQVAAMDRTGAFRLLRVLLGGSVAGSSSSKSGGHASGFLRVGSQVTERTSTWLWALLARLPERGELDYADVGAVRELGKRAVLMLASLAHVAALREEVEGLEDGMGFEDGDYDDDGGYDGGQDGDVAGGGDEGDASEKGEAGLSGALPSDGDDGDEQPIRKEDVVAAVVAEADSGGVEGGDVEEGEVEEDGVPNDEPGGGIDVNNAREEEEDDDDDQPMDLEDGEIEEGEIQDDDDDDDNPPPSKGKEPSDMAGGLEAVRSRLLAQLEPPVNLEPEIVSEAEQEAEEEARVLRARMNMRATLNMILTVAGEFYGQRDLLEFRDPFSGL